MLIYIRVRREIADKCFLPSRSTKGKAASQYTPDDEDDVFLDDFNTRWAYFCLASFFLF
jgi:hypothetical protein